MEKELTANDLSGIYREIAETVGMEATIKIHKAFKGQQVVFPKKLFTVEYIKRQVNENYNGMNIRQLATQYDYTERRLRQLLNLSKNMGSK